MENEHVAARYFIVETRTEECTVGASGPLPRFSPEPWALGRARLGEHARELAVEERAIGRLVNADLLAVLI